MLFAEWYSDFCVTMFWTWLFLLFCVTVCFRQFQKLAASNPEVGKAANTGLAWLVSRMFRK